MTENKMKVGYVYKAYHSSDPSRIYVGSTIQDLAIRLAKHKTIAKCKPHEKNKWFEYIRAKNYTGFLIEQLERVTFTHTMQLRVKENDWIIRLNPEFNMVAAHVSMEEFKQKKRVYREAHKAEIAQCKKTWTMSHRAEIAQKKKQYYETNKPEIAQKKKLYNESHKTEIAQKKKLYREAHKIELAQKSKQYHEINKNRYKCDICAYASVKLSLYNRHLASQKHKRIESNIFWQYYQNLFA